MRVSAAHHAVYLGVCAVSIMAALFLMDLLNVPVEKGDLSTYLRSFLVYVPMAIVIVPVQVHNIIYGGVDVVKKEK